MTPAAWPVFLLAALQPPSVLLFNFTSVRRDNPYLQLADIQLFGSTGLAVTPSGIDSPGGSWPSNNVPSMLFDSNPDTKWIDLSYGVRGSSLIRFTPGQLVSSYELITAGNPASRDPNEWIVSGLNACGHWVVRGANYCCCKAQWKPSKSGCWAYSRSVLCCRLVT